MSYEWIHIWQNYTQSTEVTVTKTRIGSRLEL